MWVPRSTGRLRYLLSLLAERLWVRPLGYSLTAVLLLGAATWVDRLEAPQWLPEVSYETVEQLLTIVANSMLPVATFAVASMVSAYAAASSNASPRALRLIISDQSSQNALSTFVGSFIFAVSALVAIEPRPYGAVGLLAVFGLTVLMFAWVILTFVRWVDDIARLGRMSNTLERTEAAVRRAFEEVGPRGALCGVTEELEPGGCAVCTERVGYVRHVDMEELQDLAERAGARIQVETRPGTFLYPGRPLARVRPDTAAGDADPRNERRVTSEDVEGAFLIAETRSFVQDPRFGLIVLSEIASRALSPGVNDPGTAIDVLGRQARVLSTWLDADADTDEQPRHDRVHVRPLEVDDLFTDAFQAIARDGAGSVEVGIRLMKVLTSLARPGDERISAAVRRHAEGALERAERSGSLPAELRTLGALRPGAGAVESHP